MKLIFFVFIFTISAANSARILGFVPTPSYSHQVAFHGIWEALSRAGHQVVVVTTNPINNSRLVNLTEIDVGFSYDLVTSQDLKDLKNFSVMEFITKFLDYTKMVIDQQLSHKDVQNLLNQNYDVILAEILFPELFALGYHFKAPVIAISSLEVTASFHGTMGNPTNPVKYPSYMLPFTAPLSFKQRLISFFYNYFFRSYLKIFKADPDKNEILAKHLPHVMKSVTLDEVMENYEMMFLNINPALQPVRPVNPRTILIGGGIHLKEPKPLPKEIKIFLDNAPNGVIYFSLGSNMRSEFMGAERISAILDTFRNVSLKILWKFEAEKLENLPENIKIVKWAPQQDILRHPNVKLFITQGGLQSIEEAIFSYVPMLALPFFADQENNAEIIHKKNIAIHVKNKPFDVEHFKFAINELLFNKTYYKNIKKLAKICLDQPMSGIEKAVWWTEYIIRNKDTKHFRDASQDIPFYQECFLDILAVIAATVGLLIFLFFLIVKLSIKYGIKLKNKEKIN